jgi:hypothetical protein
MIPCYFLQAKIFRAEVLIENQGIGASPAYPGVARGAGRVSFTERAAARDRRRINLKKRQQTNKRINKQSNERRDGHDRGLVQIDN